MKNLLFPLVVLLCGPPFALEAAETYAIDPVHSSIGFGKGTSEGGKDVSRWQVRTKPIKRSEYGLVWNKAVHGTALVAEEVRVAIEVEAEKKP